MWVVRIERIFLMVLGLLKGLYFPSYSLILTRMTFLIRLPGGSEVVVVVAWVEREK